MRRRYHSALSLNNMGVHLLESQCYEQAADTLKDSVSLMKSILLYHTLHPSPPIREGGEDLVLLARKRIAQPRATRPMAMLLQVFTRIQDGTFELSSPYYHDPATSSQDNLALSAFLVSIQENVLRAESLLWDENRWGTPSLTCSLLLQTAIVFHNLGIAYHCQSKTALNARTSARLRNRALGIFRISYSLLVKQHNSEGGGAMKVGMPTLFTVVLKSLIQTLLESNQRDKARRFYETLRRLKYVIVQGNNKVVPAAA